MNYFTIASRRILIAPVLLLLLLFTACDRDPGHCPKQSPVDLTQATSFATDESLPFRFPLDDLAGGQSHPSTHFCASGMETPTRREYHAAEDYLGPPGTPVYAMADGEVSFSGRMGGYGWLVIVDHPQANIYSLYGHLSPSRWRIERGPVEKGTLLGYLGDDDENGGSANQPLRPHLHLGIRAGQRSDYPGQGEWRWQAGWITPCPRDLGWLQPSVLITSQDIPPGGYIEPDGGFLEIWGIELLFGGIYLIGTAFVLLYATRRDKPWALIVYPISMVVAVLVANNKGFKLSPLLLAMAGLLLAIGMFRLIRGRNNKRDAQTLE